MRLTEGKRDPGVCGISPYIAAALLILAHSSEGLRGQVPEENTRQTTKLYREAMVRDQIEARGVRDPRVLEAMRIVPRHRFLPQALLGQAHEDYPLPIGYGQTISQPYIVAYMSELAALRPEHRVLEIGTGSGYQAAVLAQLAGEVYSIERVETLANEARERLADLGYRNIQIRFGDGFKGWPEKAPFDRIVLTAAPQQLPPALVEQLAPNGRLVAPVGPLDGVQQLVVVEKDASGRVSRRDDLSVRFVPMLEQTEGAR